MRRRTSIVVFCISADFKRSEYITKNLGNQPTADCPKGFDACTRAGHSRARYQSRLRRVRHRKSSVLRWHHSSGGNPSMWLLRSCPCHLSMATKRSRSAPTRDRLPSVLRPLASRLVGSSDDRNPVGVTKGSVALPAIKDTGQPTRASYATCRPQFSNCGLNVETMAPLNRSPAVTTFIPLNVLNATRVVFPPENRRLCTL